jgi:hypothetical protein
VSSKKSSRAILKEIVKRSLLMGLLLLGFWMILAGLGWTEGVSAVNKAAFKSKIHTSAVTLQHSKRSEIPALPIEKSMTPRVPQVNDKLHLIISLLSPSSSNATLLADALTTIKEPQTPTKLITFTPLNQTFLPDSLYYESNSTSLFEALTFAWCRVFKEQKEFPGKISILAPKSDEWCVKRTLSKVLKMKEEQFCVKTVDEPSSFQCSVKQDPFDCSNEDRLRLRYLKSRDCPELSPILLACRNEITLDRAKKFIPRLTADHESNK